MEPGAPPLPRLGADKIRPTGRATGSPHHADDRCFPAVARDHRDRTRGVGVRRPSPPPRRAMDPAATREPRPRRGRRAPEDPDSAVQADEARGPDRPARRRSGGPGGGRGRGSRGPAYPRPRCGGGSRATRARSSRQFNAYLYFRIGYGLARRLVRALYRVRLGYSDEEGLAALDPDATVVFLINHRSNMDYVLVSYLAAEKAALSYAVGEWARIWPLQTLIRSMGAYFVRRNSKDPLYRKVLERYVAMATAAGVTQAVFPEGGLSRDGNAPTAEARHPRLHGARVRPGRARRRLRPGRHQLRPGRSRTGASSSSSTRRASAAEGAAAPPRTRCASSLRNLALMARNQWHRFGYACVNFGSPVSLAAYAALARRRLPRAPEGGAVRAASRSSGDDLMAAIARGHPGRSRAARRDRLRPRARTGAARELELKAEVLGLDGGARPRAARTSTCRGRTRTTRSRWACGC